MIRQIGNLTEFVFERADQNRCALEFLRERYCYGELQNLCERVARSLLGMGASPGDRILLAAENSLFWVAAYLGVIRAGMVCVPLPASTSPRDFDHIARLTESKILFAQGGFAARRGELSAGLHVVTDDDVPLLPGAASQQTLSALCAAHSGTSGGWPAHDPDALAALMFTSGSTGRPRGVMVSHANIIANTTSIIESLELTEEDRIMTVLPFHYCYGTSLLHTHLRVGGTLVVDPRFMYPEAILQRMLESRCTGFAGVPSHFQILLRASSLVRKTFPHLRYLQQAGGRLAPAFIGELRRALPAVKLYVMYGQTEATARLSCLPPEFVDRKTGSIGKGIPGVRLRVLDGTGREVSPGEVGEIIASGANVAKGYWRAPDDSGLTFRNGDLHTGDLATVDEEGFIYIVDRANDFLKCGGERVSCGRLEEQLLECEDLLEAAVIGIPDEILGEAAKAFVVPRVRQPDGLKERVERFCRDRFPPRFAPREIVILPALPKNSAGKVLKRSLACGETIQ